MPALKSLRESQAKGYYPLRLVGFAVAGSPPHPQEWLARLADAAIGFLPAAIFKLDGGDVEALDLTEDDVLELAAKVGEGRKLHGANPLLVPYLRLV